jgi:hypothetical protein
MRSFREQSQTERMLTQPEDADVDNLPRSRSGSSRSVPSVEKNGGRYAPYAVCFVAETLAKTVVLKSCLNASAMPDSANR